MESEEQPYPQPQQPSASSVQPDDGKNILLLIKVLSGDIKYNDVGGKFFMAYDTNEQMYRLMGGYYCRLWTVTLRVICTLSDF